MSEAAFEVNMGVRRITNIVRMLQEIVPKGMSIVPTGPALTIVYDGNNIS